MERETVNNESDTILMTMGSARNVETTRKLGRLRDKSDHSIASAKMEPNRKI